MGSGELRDDFSRLAVIDAYRWWINADFGFLQQTGILARNGERSTLETGSLNETVLRRIARAYSVSRNIPSYDADAQATVIVNALRDADLKADLCKPFACRATALVGFTRRTPVVLAPNKNGKVVERALASALSKLTWFLRPEDWTIFDRFVGVAVLRKTGVGTSQMRDYYQKLSSTWGKTSAAICDAAEDHGFNRLLGYRIADKYLFCHGVGMFRAQSDLVGNTAERLDVRATIAQKLSHPSVLTMRESLLATEQALAVHLGDRLTSLAQAVAPTLAKAGWTNDLVL